MRLLLTILASLCCLQAHALNTTARISDIMRFEVATAIGTVVDPQNGAPAIWDTFVQSATPGTWTRGGTAFGNMTLDSAVSGIRLFRTRLVGGTAIIDDCSNRSIKMNDSLSKYEYMQYSFAGGAKAKVTWGYYIKVGPWTVDTESYDMVFAEQVTGGGNYAGFQFYNKFAGLETSLETQTGVSAAIMLERNKVYWVSGKWDQAANLASQAIFDPVTWAQVGSTQTKSIDFSGAGTCADLTIGRYDDHQLAPPGSFHWIDNVVIDDTGANFPMYPGSVWRADSVARTDVLAAYTAASAGGETVWIPNGSATWATGLSITKSLLQIFGFGSNVTTITLSGLMWFTISVSSPFTTV